MKKTFVSIVVALLISATMITSLASCQDTGNVTENNTIQDNSTQVSQMNQTESAEEVEETPANDETVYEADETTYDYTEDYVTDAEETDEAPADDQVIGTVNTKSAFVRSAATTKSEAIAVAYRGENVIILDTKGNWYYVEHYGQYGYIYAPYVSIEG